MRVLECLSRLEKSTRVKDRFLFKSCSFVDACIEEDDFTGDFRRKHKKIQTTPSSERLPKEPYS